MMRHFLSITDLSRDEIYQVLKLAKKLKTQLKKGANNKAFLKNKILGMLFEKPSLRTRVSFEVGIFQLGGYAIYLSPEGIRMGQRESVADVSRTLSSMVDMIMIRTFSHETASELVQVSAVPVINGLTDLEHPCQALADFQTIYEIFNKISQLKITFIGDCNNNVCHSLALLSVMMSNEFYSSGPKKYWMNQDVVKQAKHIMQKSGGKLIQGLDPKKAIVNADVVITDTWVSMGQEKEKSHRIKALRRYQVNSSLMSLAKKKAIFMHCMPVYRGNEVTSEVIDGPQSVIFQEAENRLHSQKALLLFLAKVNKLI